MNELSPVLDRIAQTAPVGTADWDDVCRRAGYGLHTRSRARRLWVVPEIAIAVAALAGIAVAVVGPDLLQQQASFHASAPAHPERIGATVEVTSQESWALIAWNSSDGLCLDFAVPGNSTFGCGFASEVTSGERAIASMVSGGNLVGSDGLTTLFGAVRADVQQVEAVLPDGTRVPGTIYAAPPILADAPAFFVVRAPIRARGLGSSEVIELRAIDRGGKLVDRAQL